LKLKSLHQQREHAESKLLHQRLVMAQVETSHLVSDLAHRSKNKMLIDLSKLNHEVLTALGHKGSLDAKLVQKKKADPAGSCPTAAAPSEAETKSEDSTAASSVASDTKSEAGGGLEPEAKKALHRQLVAKAAQVVDAQLNSILKSDELAYLKAHNELGDSDAPDSAEGDIVEEDRDARPGESPDDHYKRLMKEADQLMAQAQPHIRCEVGPATSAAAPTGAPTAAASTAAVASSTAEASSTADVSSTAESSTGESTGQTGASAEVTTAAPSTSAEATTASAAGAESAASPATTGPAGGSSGEAGSSTG